MEEWTKVSEIIQNVKSSADFGELEDVDDWYNMLKDKLSDNQVPELIRRIQRDGFTVPIYVNKSGNPYDDYFEDGWYLGNGHHRLCVAILLGLNEVLTTDEDGNTGYSGYILAVSGEDNKGAQMLADMVDTAIDWDNWPNPTF